MVSLHSLQLKSNEPYILNIIATNQQRQVNTKYFQNKGCPTLSHVALTLMLIPSVLLLLQSFEMSCQDPVFGMNPLCSLEEGFRSLLLWVNSQWTLS